MLGETADQTERETVMRILRSFAAAALAATVAVAALSAPGSARAATILHVDTGNSIAHQAKGIPDVLTADGHTVTSITNQAAAFAALNGALAGVYDLVVWDNWSAANSSEISNLTSYVTGGGRLLAVGYDSIYNSGMAGLLGGTSVSDTTSAGYELNPVVNIANSLTTGVVDIRGLTPNGVADGGAAPGNPDLDSLNGLTVGTTAVVTSVYGNHWTLRQLGAGEVAFVSSPYGFDFDNDDAVYRGALRNFAANSASSVPEPGMLATFALGLAGLGLARRRARKK